MRGTLYAVWSDICFSDNCSCNDISGNKKIRSKSEGYHFWLWFMVVERTGLGLGLAFRDALFPTFWLFFFPLLFFFFCVCVCVCMYCMCNDHACQLVAFWAVLIEKKLRPPIPRYFPTFLNSPSGNPWTLAFATRINCRRSKCRAFAYRADWKLQCM